jgi:hypothetical protein
MSISDVLTEKIKIFVNRQQGSKKRSPAFQIPLAPKRATKQSSEKQRNTSFNKENARQKRHSIIIFFLEKV